MKSPRYNVYAGSLKLPLLSVWSKEAAQLNRFPLTLQTMWGAQTLQIWDRDACDHLGLNALQRARSAAVSAKGYCGVLPRLRRMDIADTCVLCSAARRWGRHTVNCRQNRKAESCEICILTATVHKSVKSHCYTRWYTEKRKRGGAGVGGYLKAVWLWWKLLGSRIPMKKHNTEVFTVYVGIFTPTLPNCPILPSFNCHLGLKQNHSIDTKKKTWQLLDFRQSVFCYICNAGPLPRFCIILGRVLSWNSFNTRILSVAPSL